MNEGMNFERGLTRRFSEHETPPEKPELQVIVPKTPEIKRMPPDMAEVDIDEFLKRQQEEDERKRGEEKKPLFDA
ncbi:MAG: hypothetical protein ACYC1Y_01690 [Minisyncoccota bacterium]